MLDNPGSPLAGGFVSKVYLKVAINARNGVRSGVRRRQREKICIKSEGGHNQHDD